MTSADGRNESLATGPGEAAWITSSRCAGNGSCVEVASIPDGDIWVRDGKNPASGLLVFTRQEWRGFLAGVAAGDYVDI